MLTRSTTLFAAAGIALFAAVAALAVSRGIARAAGDAPDVVRYEIDVSVRPDGLRERVAVHLSPASVPRKLELRLAAAMRVTAVESSGRPLPFDQPSNGSHVIVDTKDVDGPQDVPIVVTLTVEGRPLVRFPKERGGFVRTSVGEKSAYIRSQYPWYPRRADDPATFRVTADVPEAWRVRTAGHGERGDADEGRVQWRYASDAPTREIGLVAGPYTMVEREAGNEFVLDALVFPGHEDAAQHLLGVAARAFEHYAGRFGVVTHRRFSLVEMPDAFGRGSGYGEDGYVLIGSGAFDAAGDAPWADSLVAHEVAHTWWGREVAFSNFVSESLASYATLGFVAADLGEDVARLERRKAVEAVVEATAADQEIALTDINGFGGGMDPRTYRVHAYEKGMMILSMLEDSIGREALDAELAKLIDERRGELIDYAVVRDALARSGKEAKALLARWEQPGIPELTLDHAVKEGRRKATLTGTLGQRSLNEPGSSNKQRSSKKTGPLQVTVVAICGEEMVSTVVDLKGKSARFKLDVPAAPDSVVVDPDYRILAQRPRSGSLDPDAVIKEAFGVVNSPGASDRATCEKTIAQLRALLRSGAGKHEGLCHTGIGRCLFRLDRLDEAQVAFASALRLGAGGPFHVAWIHLRLGCIADVQGDRDAALEHYRKASGRRASKSTAAMASRFLERRYRGYKKDG